MLTATGPTSPTALYSSLSLYFFTYRDNIQLQDDRYHSVQIKEAIVLADLDTIYMQRFISVSLYF